MQKVFILQEGDVGNLNVIFTGRAQTHRQCTVTCLNNYFCDGYTYERADGTCRHLERTCSSTFV